MNHATAPADDDKSTTRNETPNDPPGPLERPGRAVRIGSDLAEAEALRVHVRHQGREYFTK
jgi:hypothetical protein